MSVKYLLLVVGALFLGSGVAQADPTLKSKLSLSMEQAKQVDDIQKKYRKPFAAKRQELNKEMRVLRRANIANDSAAVARQEKITAKLRDELRAIRQKENDEIRAMLTAEQRVKFEQVLAQRKEMIGSSRDEREL
jgi:Spy/CpxP family protein refolding chaperone